MASYKAKLDSYKANPTLYVRFMHEFEKKFVDETFKDTVLHDLKKSVSEREVVVWNLQQGWQEL